MNICTINVDFTATNQSNNIRNTISEAFNNANSHNHYQPHKIHPPAAVTDKGQGQNFGRKTKF